MAREWLECPDGWKRELNVNGYMLHVTFPDSIGQCGIILHREGHQPMVYGHEFGTERAKQRAEKIFKGRL